MSALLLAVCFAAPLQDDEDEPVDLFKWARQLEALDLTWQWGEFAFSFSGEADLEFFVFGKEAPGVTVEDSAIRSNRLRSGRFADSPDFGGRLQLFLDGTFREWAEWSVEGRFDGTTSLGGSVGARFEQYWARFRPPGLPEAVFQAGKFSPPIGNFIPRSAPKKNPLTTWPLPYDHVTVLGSVGEDPASLIANRDAPDEKDWYVPIWQAVYTQGFMGSGTWKDLSYAVAVMNAAPGTLPFEWDRGFGRVEWTNLYLHLDCVLDITTKVGATASWGPYEKKDFAGGPAGPGPGAGAATGDPKDFKQSLIGLEASFMTGHLEVYGEFFWTRFETELAGHLDLWTWYVEAKYTFSASIFGAARIAQMYFFDMTDAGGDAHQWDRDVTRFEVGGGYLFAANFFAKATAQFNVHMGGREPSDNMLMVQIGLGF